MVIVNSQYSVFSLFLWSRGNSFWLSGHWQKPVAKFMADFFIIYFQIPKSHFITSDIEFILSLNILLILFITQDFEIES